MTAQQVADAVLYERLGVDLTPNQQAIADTYRDRFAYCVHKANVLEDRRAVGEHLRCQYCGLTGGKVNVDTRFGEDKPLVTHDGCAMLSVSRVTGMWAFFILGVSDGVVAYRAPMRKEVFYDAEAQIEGLIATTDKTLGTEGLVQRVEFVPSKSDAQVFMPVIYFNMAEVAKVAKAVGIDEE